MPLSGKEISVLRDNAKLKNKESAINYISKLDTLESIPVLIRILEDIQDTLKKSDTKNIQDNIRFISLAIKILKDTDEKQNKNEIALLLSLRKIKKEKMMGDLNDLKSNAKNVHIDAFTLNLWKETAIWLEGLYRHTYNRYEKAEDGVTVWRNEKGEVKALDWRDSGLYMIFKVNQIDIVIVYHHVANTLEEYINKYEAKETKVITPAVETTSKLIPSPVLLNVAAEKVLPISTVVNDKISEKLENETKLSIFPSFQTNVQSDKIQITISLSPDRSDEIPELIERLKKALINEPVIANTNAIEDKEKVASEEDVYELMQLYTNENDEIKFSVLLYIFDNWELGNRQTQLFNNFKESILANLRAYYNSSSNGFFVPTMFWPRKHIKKVEKAIEDIDNEIEVKPQVKILYKLWNDVKAECSDEVNKRTQKLLDSAYTILHKSVDPSQNKRFTMQRY